MHYTTQRFWKCYDALPESVQRNADQGSRRVITSITEFSQLMLHYEVRNVGSNGLVGR
jgi:hypothetical protein